MSDQTNLRIPLMQKGGKIPVQINGKKVTAHEGETVLALLVAQGIQVLRRSGKKNQARGMVCGMGVCYECLVTVNGVPDQQACMTPVSENMEILVDEADA